MCFDAVLLISGGDAVSMPTVAASEDDAVRLTDSSRNSEAPDKRVGVDEPVLDGDLAEKFPPVVDFGESELALVSSMEKPTPVEISSVFVPTSFMQNKTGKTMNCGLYLNACYLISCKDSFLEKIFY